ncbi:hypothetical protein GCM10010305_03560 [Streptomyces termitum]|uniref:Uncharacterized protein n=1 Tax=Streptomyces termitum TaxID=67368 RepID=A0A918SQ82_9ACTN|nr:hypothetical protein GCM10010305_03560 [Streptomyces termitum]
MRSRSWESPSEQGAGALRGALQEDHPPPRRSVAAKNETAPGTCSGSPLHLGPYSRARPAPAGHDALRPGATTTVLTARRSRGGAVPPVQSAGSIKHINREGVTMGWGTGKGGSSGGGKHGGNKDFNTSGSNPDSQKPKEEPKHKKDEKK